MRGDEVAGYAERISSPQARDQLQQGALCAAADEGATLDASLAAALREKADLAAGLCSARRQRKHESRVQRNGDEHLMAHHCAAAMARYGAAFLVQPPPLRPSHCVLSFAAGSARRLLSSLRRGVFPPDHVRPLPARMTEVSCDAGRPRRLAVVCCRT